MFRTLVILLLIAGLCPAQKDSVVVQTFYSKGKTRSIAIYKGIDTVLVLKYYKNGQLKDSARVTLKDDKEFYYGTQKSFYKNSSIASITHYKNGYDEFEQVSYRENGSPLSEIKKPGVRKFYNKKGEIVKQIDINYSDQVYVTKKFRRQKNINDSSSYLGKNNLQRKNTLSRLKSKKAYLIADKNKLAFNTGSLISIILNSDTAVLTHCFVEGFSNDTLFISKFEYNSNAKKDQLQYDSTFSLAFNQLQTVYYSKKYTRKKHNRASAATIGGLNLILIPIALTPFAATSLGTLTPFIGACIVVGIPMYIWGKQLYKKMVPKKYDMKQWKIAVKPKG